MRSRRTPQLVAVETVLRETADHPTAAEIHRRVEHLLPQVSLGTVYRNLEKMVRDGRAVPVRLDGEATRYDGTVAVHDHFVCRGCGGITDLLEPMGPRVDTAALERAGYAVAAHSLALYGTCPACC